MKHAVFFCENCGKPVPLDASECPHCKSRFTAVQCPKCSFVGEAKQFVSGCPRCGYLAQPTGQAAGVPRTTNGPAVVPASPPPGNQSDDSADRAGEDESLPPLPKYRRSSPRLPGWFYTVASILLLIALIVLGILVLNIR